jgi:hypothetical protein
MFSYTVGFFGQLFVPIRRGAPGESGTATSRSFPGPLRTTRKSVPLSFVMRSRAWVGYPSQRQVLFSTGQLCRPCAGSSPAGWPLGAPAPSAAGASFLLGKIKGRHGPCSITVGLDGGRLMLRVGRQQEPLANALLWDRSGLSIDRALFRRLAHRKGAAPPSRVSRPPDRTTQQEGVRNTRARHKAIYEEANRRRAAREGSWTAIAAAVAETDLALTPSGRRLSAASLRRIIADMRKRERESFCSNHRARISP